MAENTAICGIYDKALARVLKKSANVYWYGENSNPSLVSNGHFIFAVTEAHVESRIVAMTTGKLLEAVNDKFQEIVEKAKTEKLYSQPALQPTDWLVDSWNRYDRLLTNGQRSVLVQEVYLSLLDGVGFRLLETDEMPCVVVYQLGLEDIIGFILLVQLTATWMPDFTAVELLKKEVQANA